MAKQSTGILVYRRGKNGVEVFLTHPAGPFWAKKDTWSIPKGELDDGEDHLVAARREFIEETSLEPPEGEYIELGEAKQGSSKVNHIWAIEGDLDPAKFVCTSTFTLEWPPKSGNIQEFPENDRAAWFDIATSKQKLFKAQVEFIDRLIQKLSLDEETVTAEAAQQTLL